jgi:hypothetical protein
MKVNKFGWNGFELSAYITTKLHIRRRNDAGDVELRSGLSGEP